MKVKHKISGLVRFILMLIFLVIMYSAAFFITDYIYKILDWELNELLNQIINSIFGLILTGLMLSIIRKIALSKGWMRKRDAFGTIIEAVERIATGDFSIRLDDDDIHEHYPVAKLRESVNKMALELDKMENMRQEFISNVSHEIQSPLTSISGFAEILGNEELSLEERQHYLGIIRIESKRLSRLSDNLLQLASLDAETIKFEPEVYHLDEQVRNLILACEPQWAVKKVEIELVLDKVSITADKDMLTQAWINLINNSIKYTPEGGRIKIELYQESKKVLFKITDTGIGIAEEDQKHIFERFFKTDKSRQRSKKGNGLGLSIVKKIIDMHHGEIEVDSKLGEGTSFTVLLPVKQ
ncbi:GHKL domain-containing protein [Iocasia frigidifontis]|uniref:histidine kinase n=1 Tax=Iocasia fonsfrigidae TaxID=2682810 RepID=A0A8A7K5T9_9FIRM|nr:HAMP domain-containing sensor histidine kinase [Iocasia fonsfrigidae]QTL96671.1 GHKL domain-containing protein [Iocasia fonsfrigidae]